MWLATLAAVAAANPYSDPPAAASPVANPFVWEAKALTVTAGSESRLELWLHVPIGTEVYQDQLEVGLVESGGLTVGAPDYPPALAVPDAADGQGERLRYVGDVVVYLPVRAEKAGSTEVVLSTRHQGCRGRLCFPPVTDTLRAAVKVTEPGP